MTKQLYKALLAKHPDYEAKTSYWELLGKMAAGGCQIGLREKIELLICPGTTDPDLLRNRAEVAVFEPTMGGIITKMVSQLCRDEAIYQGSDDEYYQEFLKSGYVSSDSEAGRASFHRFLVDCLYCSLVKQIQIAQVDTPSSDKPASNMEEEKAAGGYDAYVIKHDRAALWDWQTDKRGLTFAKLHFYREEKKDWRSPSMPVHEFLIFERLDDDSVVSSKYIVKPKKEFIDARFKADVPVTNDAAAELESSLSVKQLKKDRDCLEKTPFDKVEVTKVFERKECFYATGKDGKKIYKFPIIVKRLPSAMCIGDQLYDLQRGAFNMGSSGNWAEKATNYSMPVYEPPSGVDANVKWNGNPLEFKKQGAGYYMEIAPGSKLHAYKLHSQQEIQLAWDREQVYKQRMLDVVQQISTIAAASYIPQSGESKKEDRRSLDILLEVYGQYIREFAKDVLDVVAIARNEVVDWTVQGFSDYDSEGLEESLKEYLAIDQAGIDSPTLRREAQKTLARRYAQEYGLSDEKIKEVTDELDKEPFHLNVDELEAVGNIWSTMAYPPEKLTEIMQAANYIPRDIAVGSKSGMDEEWNKRFKEVTGETVEQALTKLMKQKQNEKQSSNNL